MSKRIFPTLCALAFSHLLTFGQDVDSSRATWQDTTKPDSVRFMALYDLVWDEYAFSAPDSAIILAKQMQQQAEETVSIRFQAMGLDLQAVAWYVKGDLRKALSFYGRSLPMHERDGNNKSVADVTTNMASMYSFLGAHDTALTLYAKGLATHELLNDSLAIANDMNAIGRVHMVHGDHARAIEFYRKSLRIMEALKDQLGLATGHACLGSLYINQGDYDQALLEYEAALRLAEGSNSVHQVAKAHAAIGTCLEELQDTTAAMDHYRMALEAAQSLDDQLTIASAMNNIAALELKQGLSEKALQHYTEAAAIARSADHPFGEASALVGRALALLALHEPAEALKAAHKASVVATEAEDLTLERDAAQALYRVYKTLGRPAEALAAHERYLVMEDSLMREENQREVIRFQLAHVYEQQAMSDSLRLQEQQLQLEASHAIELAEERTRRFMLLGFIVIVMLLGAGVWSRARHTSRANREILSAQGKLVEAERRREAALVRTRIASDIHDELGSNLTKIGLLGKEVSAVNGSGPNTLAPMAERMAVLSVEANKALSDLVWATDQQNDSAKELVDRAHHFTLDLCQAASIPVHTDFAHEGPDFPLSPEDRHDLFLTLKELVNNAVKHSQASQINVTFHTGPKGYLLRVQDNGRGFDELVVVAGKGSRSMRTRSERLDCSPIVHTSPGKGCLVIIEGRWPGLKERLIPNEHDS